MSWFDSIAKAVSEAVEIGTRDLQEFVGTVTEDTTSVTQSATQVAASALNAAAAAVSAAAVVASAEADRLTSIIDTELEERDPSKQVGNGTIQTSKDSTNNSQTALSADASTEPVCTNDVDTNTNTSLAETIEQSSTTTISSSSSLPFSPTKALNAAEIAKERLKKIEAAEEEPLGWGDEES